MAKQTIIDWQRNSLMVAVGQSHGASVSLDKLNEQSIGPSSVEGDAAVHNGDAAQALVRAVDELGIRKSDVIVVVAREIVELRTLAVPRVDPSELPDIIRFQAQRQLANMGDNWTLDFVLLPEEPGQEMLTALVGAISPTALAEIESACAAAGVQLVSLALAPIEIARYGVTSGKLAANGAALVVCVSERHADLLILNEKHVVQVRATKLPTDAAQLASSLGGELRRSLMAASNQLGGKSISSAVLFANAELASPMRQVIAEVVDCPVSVVDPADLLPHDLAQGKRLSHAAAHRLAALAGAVNFAEADKKTKFDFKHPKRRPPPKSRTTTYLMAGAAAAVLALAGVSWWVSENNTLDQDLALYRDQVASKKELVAVAKERIADLREVETFLEASPNWLDELTYIAEKIPASEKVILGEPTFSTLGDGKGQISIPVAADSSASISAFEASLSDENHQVFGKDIRQLDQPTQLYKWQGTATIVVQGRGWKLVDELATSRSATTNVPEEAKPAEPAVPADALPIPDKDKQANADGEDNRSARWQGGEPSHAPGQLPSLTGRRSLGT